MQYENRNIGSILAELAEIDPDAHCIEQDGIRYSRIDIIRSAQSYVGFFKDQGVKDGGSIAIIAVDRRKGFEAMIALWSIGAAVLFIDPRQTIDEIKRAKANAQVDIVFSDSKSFCRRGEVTLLPSNIVSDTSNVPLHFSAQSFENYSLILSSSGTTGTQKFRLFSHQDIINELITTSRIINKRGPLNALSVGSFAFGAVLSHWIKLQMYGQFLVSFPLFFRVNDLHQALSRDDIQAVALPPVIIGDLLEFNRKNQTISSGPAYPNIKVMTSYGGPLSSEALERTYKYLTPGIVNVYSLSGAGVVSMLSGSEILKKSRSVGKPFPEVTVSIVDSDGTICSANEIGQIFAHPSWKQGAKNVNTGDTGWIDEDGYLFINGRSAQIASRNSINISLIDLEADVKRVIGVRDCIAFTKNEDGSPDDLIYLVVEAREDLNDTKKRIKSSLTSYRRPDKILILQNLPRTPSNKIALSTLKLEANQVSTPFVDF